MALYTSAPNTMPVNLSHALVQVICTVTGVGTASASANLIPGCTSGIVGNSSGSLPLLSYDSLPAATGVDTSDSSEELLLGLNYGSGGTPVPGDHVTLLSAITEFIQ